VLYIVNFINMIITTLRNQNSVGVFSPFIIPHYMFRPPYRPSSSAYNKIYR
jgi:hypothetical protein